MVGSVQDCSLIQDFEVDFPQKVSLKILNLKKRSAVAKLVEH